MTHIKNTKFVCIDVESTGLDFTKERIIEVAAVLFTENTIIAEFETLVNPEIEIPQSSYAVHNISDEMVKGAPIIKQVLPELLHFIGDSIIVGHGIEFDINIVLHEAMRAEVDCSLRKNVFFDTLRLARLYGESPSNSLQALREHFNIIPEGAHRAKSDVIVNIQVFKHLIAKFTHVEEIVSALSKPIAMKKMPLGKHKGRLFKEIPLDYLLWAAHQEFDADLLFSIRSEIGRRKKGGSFQQSTNPFNQLSL